MADVETAQRFQTDTAHMECMGVTPLRSITSQGAQTPTSAVVKTYSFIEEIQLLLDRKWLWWQDPANSCRSFLESWIYTQMNLLQQPHGILAAHEPPLPPDLINSQMLSFAFRRQKGRKSCLLEVPACTQRWQQYLSFTGSQALLLLGKHIHSKEEVI